MLTWAVRMSSPYREKLDRTTANQGAISQPPDRKKMAFNILLTPQKIQRWIKFLLRAIQYFASACLILFLIRLYTTGQKETSKQLILRQRTDNREPSTNKRDVQCPGNMFISRKRCLPCPLGHFSFPGWSECQPWLNCNTISLQVRPRARILGGLTKQVWLAGWNGYQVVYSNCSRSSPGFTEKCLHGIKMMEQLQGVFVSRLIGMCYEKVEVS